MLDLINNAMCSMHFTKEKKWSSENAKFKKELRKVTPLISLVMTRCASSHQGNIRYSWNLVFQCLQILVSLDMILSVWKFLFNWKKYEWVMALKVITCEKYNQKACSWSWEKLYMEMNALLKAILSPKGQKLLL